MELYERQCFHYSRLELNQVSHLTVHYQLEASKHKGFDLVMD